MKDTARKKDGRQESPNIGQLALAAMFDARWTLYETVIHAGVSVLAGDAGSIIASGAYRRSSGCGRYRSRACSWLARLRGGFAGPLPVMTVVPPRALE
jgi:hypothetical protein